MIHLRMKSALVKNIDYFVQHGNYKSRTEFLNDAAREKADEKMKTEAIKRLKENLGKGKVKRLDEKELDKRAEKWVKNNPSKILGEFGFK